MLDVTNRGEIVLWERDKERKSQIWKFDVKDGHLENLRFGKCLDALGINEKRDMDGCPLGLWAKRSHKWQLWRKEGSHILNQDSGKAIDALGRQGRRDFNGCPVGLWRAGQADWQKWEFIRTDAHGNDLIDKTLVDAASKLEELSLGTKE